MENNKLFNAAVKVIEASNNMTDDEYIKFKEYVLVACADIGKGARHFIHDVFEIADKRRGKIKELQ